MTIGTNYWNTERRVANYVHEITLALAHNPTDTATLLLKITQGLVSTDPQIGTDTLADICCGPGIVAASFIKTIGCKDLLAVDISEKMLDVLPQHVDSRKTRVTIQHADVAHHALNAGNATVNIAVCSKSTIYLPCLKNLFSEVARILKPGGLFCFSALTHEHPTMGPYVYKTIDSFLNKMAHSRNDINKYVKTGNFRIITSITTPEDSACTLPLFKSLYFLQKM